MDSADRTVRASKTLSRGSRPRELCLTLSTSGRRQDGLDVLPRRMKLAAAFVRSILAFRKKVVEVCFEKDVTNPPEATIFTCDHDLKAVRRKSGELKNGANSVWKLDYPCSRTTCIRGTCVNGAQNSSAPGCHSNGRTKVVSVPESGCDVYPTSASIVSRSRGRVQPHIWRPVGRISSRSATIGRWSPGPNNDSPHHKSVFRSRHEQHEAGLQDSFRSDSPQLLRFRLKSYAAASLQALLSLHFVEAKSALSGTRASHTKKLDSSVEFGVRNREKGSLQSVLQSGRNPWNLSLRLKKLPLALETEFDTRFSMFRGKAYGGLVRGTDNFRLV
ncbi:unnamed protein product [Protopolystoma xenopodis]|uniref:Uncharacterized protein n=1 Tax=Protopolystoma xenopodis TaxID=117903 RepID=A0A448WBV4_9PLAT|nr:unnamed protein product [Protopolystoma xenopodis]